MRTRFAVLILLLFLSGAVSATDVIYHLHQANQNKFLTVLNNMENMLKKINIQNSNIILILQGKGIQILAQTKASGISQRLTRLQQRGIKIETSEQNYIRLNKSAKIQPLPDRLLKNTFTRLIELQQKGYVYIKP